MGRGTLAALKIAVVVMGVMIVVGVVALAVLIVGRTSAPTRAVAGPLVLDEPEGTAIVGAAAAGDRLVLQLRGGGPDRVVVFDLRGGGASLRVGLAR